MITLSDVKAAQQRIGDYVLHTPLLRVPALDEPLGCQVYLKPENLQITGSFKLRGATNRMLTLTEEERKLGVVCSSSGNHAQGVACAAQRLGISAVIVMPTDCNPAKLDGVKSYGATALLEGTLSTQRDAKVRALCESEGRIEVHPYADPYVAAGQGTIGLEILKDEPELNAVVVPVGGGGLITGVATAIKGLRPTAKVIGVEPAGAPRYALSRKAGKLVLLERADTIADGTRTVTGTPGNFGVIEALVDDILEVGESSIRKAMRLVVSRAKIVAEPSSVLGIAAALEGKLAVGKDDKVCFVISGGNNDLSLLAQIITS